MYSCADLFCSFDKCFVSLKCWCWSLRSVFTHLYRESAMYIHERTRCFYFLLRGRFTGTSYWRWKGSQLHPLRFKNTTLLTPWCQKLEHYHFKHNLQFEAKEIKIRVVLFLVLEHMKYREAWNSPTTSCFIFCMLSIMAHVIQNRFPSTFVTSPGFPFHSSIWATSLLFCKIRVRLLEDATEVPTSLA